MGPLRTTACIRVCFLRHLPALFPTSGSMPFSRLSPPLSASGTMPTVPVPGTSGIRSCADSVRFPWGSPASTQLIPIFLRQKGNIPHLPFMSPLPHPEHLVPVVSCTSVTHVNPPFLRRKTRFEDQLVEGGAPEDGGVFAAHFRPGDVNVSRLTSLML